MTGSRHDDDGTADVRSLCRSGLNVCCLEAGLLLRFRRQSTASAWVISGPNWLVARGDRGENGA